jgi:hypothetical protein
VACREAFREKPAIDFHAKMKKRGLLFFTAGIVGLLILAGIGAGIIWFRIQALKARLAIDVGNALGATVEVAALDIDLWKGEMHASNITLVNNRPDAPWDRGEIAQATVRFHWHDFFAPVQPLSVEVDSWRLVLHPGAAPGETVPAGGANESAPEGENAPPEKLTRHGIEVTHLTAQNGDVEIDLADNRQVMIHGISFDAENNGGGTWNTQVQAESCTAGTLQTGPGSVSIRADAEKIVFENLHLQCDQGMITGGGDIAVAAPHEAHAMLQAVDVPVTMLVSAPWRMKLSGLASGDLNYHGDDQTADAQGGISVREGKFNVLPFLGALVSIVGLPDLTGVELDQATAHYDWKDRALHLTQIDVRKNDVVRIAGDVDVDPTGQVDGRLKVGLPDSLASKWPQLQAAIFSSQEDGYGWTDVHLTGTPDHLQEDLTPRLLAAGLQTGGALLDQGKQKAMDLLKSFFGP